MGEAVRRAAALATAGDVVLLSPACASFDLFRDYEHRGAVFVEEVRARPFSDQDPPSPLEDPELALRREEGELLGSSAAALTDALTLLYGYRYFHETLAAEADRATLQGRPFGVVLAELRDLQEINHERGFAAGDDHLRTCGRAVTRVAVRHGAVACRPSGSRVDGAGLL